MDLPGSPCSSRVLAEGTVIRVFPGMMLHQLSLTCLSSHNNRDKRSDLVLPPLTQKASKRRVAAPCSESFFIFPAFLPTDSHVLLYQDSYFCLQLYRVSAGVTAYFLGII